MIRPTSWFEKTPRWRDLPIYILVGVLCCFYSSLIGIAILRLFGLQVSDANVAPMPASIAEFPIATFFLGILGEEIIFRLPLFLITLIGWRSLMLPSTLILSGVFGWIHGDWTNVPIQGVNGLILCSIFLSCGGARRKFFNGVFKGLVASYTTHILINLFITLIFLLRS